jgi:hypothetical protein
MEEIDFERLEKIVTKLTDGFDKKLDAQSKDFQHKLDLKLDVQSKDFQNKLDLKLDVQNKDFQHKLDLKLDAQSKDFHTWIGVQGEDFQHKLDLEVEGFQMLAEKIDRFGIKLDQVETGLDGVAASIAAHRMDTEAHQGLYRVKER